MKVNSGIALLKQCIFETTASDFAANQRSSIIVKNACEHFKVRGLMHHAIIEIELVY